MKILQILLVIIWGLFRPTLSMAVIAEKERVRSLLDQSGIYTDLRDARQSAALNELRALNSDALPILVELFDESEDDQYRAAIISVSFSLHGAKSSAVEFVGNELAKDVRDWHGRRWLFEAIVNVENADPSRVAAYAARILDLDDPQLRAQALSMIQSHGNASHLPRLESFLRERSKIADQTGRDGLSIAAQLAISHINQRLASSTTPPPAMSVTAKSPGVTPVALPAAAAEVPQPKSSNGWVWLGGAILAVFLLLLSKFLRKKKR